MRDLDEAASLAAAQADRPVAIRVRSPQFEGAAWVYSVFFDGAGVRVEQAADGWVASGCDSGLNLLLTSTARDRACASPSASPAAAKNKFVHLALQRTLALALEARGAGALQNSLSYGLDVTIVGDNDFYSQRAQVRRIASTISLPLTP